MRPQIYAKGGDYTVDSLDSDEVVALKEIGARIRNLAFSTWQIDLEVRGSDSAQMRRRFAGSARIRKRIKFPGNHGADQRRSIGC